MINCNEVWNVISDKGLPKKNGVYIVTAEKCLRAGFNDEPDMRVILDCAYFSNGKFYTMVSGKEEQEYRKCHDANIIAWQRYCNMVYKPDYILKSRDYESTGIVNLVTENPETITKERMIKEIEFRIYKMENDLKTIHDADVRNYVRCYNLQTQIDCLNELLADVRNMIC